MTLTKKDLDTKWQMLFRDCKKPESAKAEILKLFSEEPDDKYTWSEQDIYEQMSKD